MCVCVCVCVYVCVCVCVDIHTHTHTHAHTHTHTQLVTQVALVATLAPYSLLIVPLLLPVQILKSQCPQSISSHTVKSMCHCTLTFENYSTY